MEGLLNMNPFGDDDYAKGPAYRAEIASLEAEVKRLHAENNKQALDGMETMTKLRAENAELKSGQKSAWEKVSDDYRTKWRERGEEIDRLRAENAVLRTCPDATDEEKRRVIAQLVELDWFRRRESVMEEIVGGASRYDYEALRTWEKHNPKPG